MASNQLPSPKITLTNQEARRFTLAHQYLWPPRKIKGKPGILELFNHLGCVQFDTINVVGRNADLVLQARVKDYRPTLLEELLYQDRLLIDGWDKVASIYQTNDWRYFSRHRQYMSDYHHRRSSEVAEHIPQILSAVEENGPISSLYFKDFPKTDWFWSSTSLPRAVMETLYVEGQLGVARRINTRREFDLIDRLVPAEILNQEDPNQNEEAYHEWHILRRIGSMGLASPASGEHWQGIVHLRTATKRSEVLSRLTEKELITPVTVEGLENRTMFMRTSDLEMLETMKNSKPPKFQASFIAPLDNLIWNRKLVGELFNFKYVWEVYKPKTQREYGYYVLPVLYGDSFIARVDMKLDRKTNILNILNWWWEKGAKRDDNITQSITDCFLAFKDYLGAEKFEIDPSASAKTFLKKVTR
jgi:uncharacterized protein YcaQ